MSGEAALVALVLEDQQMNDTINVIPHTICQVAYCRKPLQLTTPEEDADMLIRRKRETVPSPEPGAMSEVEEGNIVAHTDPSYMLIRRKRESVLFPEPDADSNPYTAELLNLKQERTLTRKQKMQDPELEEVLNAELAGITLEDRVIELRLALEDDQAQRREEKEEEHELREREISGLMCYIGKLQKEYREGYREVIGMLVIQVNDIREALFLFNRHMLSEYGKIILNSTKSTRESSPVPLLPTIIMIPIGGILALPKIMSYCTFTADGKIRSMNPCSNEEANNDRSINIFDRISDDPKKDTYIKGCKPVHNRGASNQLEDGYLAPKNEVEDEPPAPKAVSDKKEDQDRHMTNNAVTCLPGLKIMEAEVTATMKEKEKEDAIAIDKMFQRANTPANRLLGPEDHVIAAIQKGVIKHMGAYRGRAPRRQTTLPYMRYPRQTIPTPNALPKAEVAAAMKGKEKEARAQKGASKCTNSNRKLSRQSTSSTSTLVILTS
ncbi:hypothetical protein L211DRAFT_849605 [Terfezia boudieri ATCC MYA-4762]|uniref:Uncharacterized protein n=1 Tax=Terfezia boudieri ATCC MYA-4762 TaxID=1051890 RepID=A0A3N4LL04_9PEZI|nr:hypothetical protein L211DRAFT_849605 [Terfezia boudieri ATCC MYA-4762]